ncbi:MAG: 23S rRNA (uracil(1939)-C(5))-methyltransferase RlmD [Clostridia bacterium]|nr:23S rRNA (uracil(1939)-C(5))-methyltransferase RlmD [Clostridia bacterium]
MKKNDELEVLIEGYSADGAGVAKPDGFVLFIPGTIVGERVLAHVTKLTKNYGYAKAMKIIAPSEHRVCPDCEKAAACGGCQLRHMSYAEQLSFKKQKVEANMRKAGITCPVSDTLPSPALLEYRNKAQYPIRMQGGKITGGFYRQNSHTVIECECVIQPRIFNDILRATLDFMTEHKISAYDEQTLRGTVRHLYLRRGKTIMVCLVVKGDFPLKKQFSDKLRVQFPEISTVCINYNDKNTNVVLGDRYETVYGEGYITDTLMGYEFDISPESFYQVNRDGCEVLYGEVKRHAAGARSLLDLYCGIGTIGICVSDKVESLTGIEIVEKAIENARANALKNNITSARFAAMDAKSAGEFADGQYDTIIVDPPRKGCDIGTLEYLESKAPERLIYVSCDSATLARDLKILTEKGFEVKEITPVDMFPSTYHVETVVLLVRQL